MAVLALLAARHFATSPWPLSGGQPGVLVAVCLLLLLAQGFKAWGWGRLFSADERPRPLALAAGNGGAALIGVVLPGRFDDAMRVAVVRRYPGCRAGVRALCLSLVMLGLIDSVALAPLAAAAAVLGGGIGVRAGLTARRCRGRCRRRPAGRPASPRRKQARLALPARPLAESAHHLEAALVRGVGARVGLLAPPRARLLPPAGDARGRLLVSTGAASALCGRGSGSGADRPCGSGDASRRRRRGFDRFRRRGSQALAVTLAGGALGVLTGAAILLAAIVWRAGLSLATTRIGACPPVGGGESARLRS